jgi:quercetin dioxygenase-like cupin family protein
MKRIDIKDLPMGETPGVDLRQVFEVDISGKSKFKMGTVVFPPGARVPKEGYGSHEGDECSIVISGRIVTESGGERCAMESGQASLIPAGEEHWALNESDEDCRVVWVLLEP